MHRATYTWKKHTDEATYMRRTIYTDGHIHEGDVQTKRHTYGGNIYTKKTYAEREHIHRIDIYGAICIRSNIHIKEHAYRII